MRFRPSLGLSSFPLLLLSLLSLPPPPPLLPPPPLHLPVYLHHLLLLLLMKESKVKIRKQNLLVKSRVCFSSNLFSFLIHLLFLGDGIVRHYLASSSRDKTIRVWEGWGLFKPYKVLITNVGKRDVHLLKIF